MKLVCAEQIKIMDQEAVEKYDIPSILLMEHAAYGVWSYIKAHKVPQKVIIFCGPGNNGGDGLALARHLYGAYEAKEIKNLQVILLCEEKSLSEDGKTYLKIDKRLGVPILQYDVEKSQAILKAIEDADLIIDAIFGTGLSRNVEGMFKLIIEAINKSNAKVMSMDIPSGIHGTSGKVMGIAIQADHTFTFAVPKLGLYLYPGIDYIGKLHVVDIGMPKEVIKDYATTYRALTKEEVIPCLPPRYTRSHKGSYGRVLTIGGKMGMSGAITLTSMACMKVGAGLVTASVPQSIHNLMEVKLTEAMTMPLPDQEGVFLKEAFKKIEDCIENYDVVAIGPGIGRSPEVRELLKIVLTKAKKCVIDADGLYALKNHKEYLKEAKGQVVLTPHLGEFSRLIGEDAESILEDPIIKSQAFSDEYGVTTVLKLERMIITSPNQSVFINTTGNSGMAKGGSGDVLTGVITGLLAQGLSPIEASTLGAYIHGKAGDLCKIQKGIYSFLPTDLIEALSDVLKALEAEKKR